MSTDKTGSPEWLSRTLLDLDVTFPTPESVVEYDDLTSPQKIEVLRAWAYDASEAEVAEEEGMPGLREHLLQRILLAIGRLESPPVGEAVAVKTDAGIIARTRNSVR